jgi:Uma2 family endonuclease
MGCGILRRGGGGGYDAGMATISPSSAVRPYRWSRREYQKLNRVPGLFRRRVELLGGQITTMSALSVPHAVANGLTDRAISSAFGPSFWVRNRAPLQLDRWSAPEPDFAVVPGRPGGYVDKGHPKIPLLVIEVSDATLSRDRRLKGPRYARAGYADYWIVNLVDNQLEVYRKAVADPSAKLGWRYSDVTVLKPSATISPLAAPAAVVAVADLLPRKP